MDYEIRVEEAQPRTIACTWREVPREELGLAITGELSEVWEWIRENEIEPTGHNVVVYLTARYESGRLLLDCMFGVEVPEDAEPEDGIIISATPEGTVATTTHWGSYAGIQAANDAIVAWCAANGRRTGASWEVYGDWSDDPTKMRTDIYYELTN